MNISIFGDYLLKPLANSLEKDGYNINFNKFSSNADLVIVQFQDNIYDIYNSFKKYLKKKKIKIINIILDIPPWRLEKSYPTNTYSKYLRQSIFNFLHKNQFINNQINYFSANGDKGRINNFVSKIINKALNTQYYNRVFYQINYRKFLKNSDLNLSISKFTQKITKKFLKVNSTVWYPCVNSDILLNFPKPNKYEYDAINISRIVKTKRQDVFVNAAKLLGLKIMIIGHHQDKQIKLDAPHIYLPDHFSVLKELNKAEFYVDASIYEGFGMTPIEAAFLDKITFASDIYTHKEILEDYPIYFKKNDVKDLAMKMKMVKSGDFVIQKEVLEKIKKKYSIQAAKERLLKHIESLF